MPGHLAEKERNTLADQCLEYFWVAELICVWVVGAVFVLDFHSFYPGLALALVPGVPQLCALRRRNQTSSTEAEAKEKGGKKQSLPSFQSF